MTEVGDHYRPTGAGHSQGVYRVVGTSDGMALLRVTDGDGRRAHTGQVIQVDAEKLETDFERTGNPDAGFSPVNAVLNQFQGLYWQFRKFF